MSVDCLVLAPVGERWMQAALPDELRQLLTLHIVEPTATTVGGVGDELIGVARDLLLEALVLFGHSMNGTLALAAAAAHPDVIRGVIAVGAPPQLPPDVEGSANYWELNAGPERKQRFEEYLNAHEATTDEAERVRLRARANALRQWHDIDFDATALDALLELEPAWPAAIFADASSVDWPATLAGVRCPVFLAFGQSDFVCPPTMWTGDELPNADVTTRIFGSSAHNAYIEQPDEFLGAMQVWVGRHFSDR